MTNPIKDYLKSIHTASRSQSDKKAALDLLNESLGTSLSSNEMFEKIHLLTNGSPIHLAIVIEVLKSLLHKPIDSRFTHKFSKIIKVQTKTT